MVDEETAAVDNEAAAMDWASDLYADLLADGLVDPYELGDYRENWRMT